MFDAQILSSPTPEQKKKKKNRKSDCVTARKNFLLKFAAHPEHPFFPLILFTALSLLLPLCGGIAVWMCWAGLWSETTSRSSACQNTSVLATGCHCRPGSQWDASSEGHPLSLQVIGQIEKHFSDSVRAFVVIFSLWKPHYGVGQRLKWKYQEVRCAPRWHPVCLHGANE